MTDPAPDVDDFHKRTEELTNWYNAYYSDRQQRDFLYGDVFTELDKLNPWSRERLKDLVQLLKAQNYINVELLAAIDELKKQLSDIQT